MASQAKRPSGPLLSEGSSPPNKKPKGTSCKCLACGGTPKQKTWAFHQRTKRDQELVPIDDKCEACWSTFEDNFKRILNWTDFSKHVQTDEGKATLTEIKNNRGQQNS